MIPPREQLEPLGAVAGLLPPLTLLSLFLSPPRRSLNFTLVPFFLFSALYTSIFYTTGSPPDDYGRASLNFSLALKAIDTFLLSKPTFEITFRHKSSQVPHLWSWKRLKWAMKVITGMRGAGWDWQVQGVPSLPPQHTSRKNFITNRIFRTVYLYLAMDVVSTYMQSRPYFHNLVSLDSLPRNERLLNMMCACAAGGLAISILHNLLSAICVASGAWEPKECPDLFGNWREASSLKGWWGRVWHQSFRRPFTTIPRFILHDLLHLDRSSPSSRFFSIFLAFSLSGLQHAFGSYTMARRGRGAMKFFLVQPFGILIESMVSNRFKGRFLSKGVRKFVGYLWTMSWLLFWCPYFFDELVQAGMWKVDAAPFSVVKGIWKGQWLKVQ